MSNLTTPERKEENTHKHKVLLKLRVAEVKWPRGKKKRKEREVDMNMGSRKMLLGIAVLANPPNVASLMMNRS